VRTARQHADPAGVPPVVVLVEGRSDVGAVAALLGRAGIAVDARVDVVDMGGVTNIRQQLHRFVQPGRARRIVGLCDEGETRYFVRALELHGLSVERAEDMAGYGFHVCRADLEDELIRALGTGVVLGVVDGLGLSRRFERFQDQEFWRGRDLHDQLHRFAGIASGRKSRFAAALAEAVAPDGVPTPLRALVDHIRAALRTSGTPPLHPFP
jgi:hypothetical protein